MTDKKNWVVVTSAGHSLGEVQKQLTEKGFTVEQVLEEIGCITGYASDDVAEKVRSIPGVSDISPDSPIDIGPPDAPVTW